MILFTLRTEMMIGNWSSTGWYWYWLVLGGTGSVQGGTGWYMVVLGQYGAELVGSW